MRRYLLILFVLLVQYAHGQQIPQFSQYIWNNYLINPAIGGAESFIDWKAGYRDQWVGIEGAPKTYYLTMHGQFGKKIINREDVDVVNRSMQPQSVSKFHKLIGFKKRKFATTPASFRIKPHHGAGAQIMNDRIGPFNTLAIYGSYAYHIPLAKEVYLSMGAFLGVKQFKIDANKITTRVEDNAISPGLQGIVPDGMVGLMAYGNKFYAGASISHIFYNSFNFKDELGRTFSTTNSAQLVGHYFLMGGYRFQLGEHIAIVPSTMVRILPGTPPSIDLTGKFNYKDIVWAGASLRSGDALIFLVGLAYLNKYQIGYSYDLTTSNLRNFNIGTHEIVIGFRLINKPNKGCKPSYVW